MKQNLLFNQASALGKRLAMVLTMLLTVGIGQAWGADYELVSFSDIKTNDVIIIVGTKSNTAYAMKNTGTPPTPIAVTISNSKITSTATDITFTATNNGDNTITFVSTTSGTLYCTNANNGVKIGSQTGNNTKFSFDSSVNRLKNIGQTRWLGIYNTQDWRCYTSATQSNIAGTTTTFYRKVTATPSYKVTATSNNDSYGTVSVSGTTITASPKTGYTYANPAYTVTSGTATVTQNGNTFTVTPSSDCSIQINFAEKVKNTYIDNVQGNSTQTLYDTHSAPSLTDKDPATTGTCEQQHWHFMGWVIEANKENPTDVNIVKANTSVTANGTTYYAVWAKGTTTGGGSTSKQYSFDITPSNFNSTSYAANNNEKTSTAKASDGSTLSVKWTSYQVMLQSSVMQWQSGKGYIYNSTDLGTINSVTVTSTAGTFTKYYGTSQQPSSNTTVGNGYFQIKVGNATGKTSKVTVTFTKTTQGAQTTTYSDYTTSCTTQTVITLNPNGGTIGDKKWTLENDVYKLTTEDESITLPTITRTGYTFGGWATSSDGTKEHNANATINLDGTPVTLHAIWTANIYNITYKDQGNVDFSGTHEGGYPTQHTYGIETTLKGATKIGYTFEGWHTDAACTNKVTTLGATEYTGDITLYAKWEEIPTTCTITYDANGGKGTITDATEYANGAKVTVKGNFGIFTKDGYAFTGWNTQADGSGDSYKHNDQFTITTNTTLYAQWCKAHWKLVTDVSEIENDTRIVIAAKDFDFALSTTQNTNNRDQAAITKKYNTIVFEDHVQVLSLVGLEENRFALYTGSGYLYAAGSDDNNYLKTRPSINGNCYWSIAISQIVADIHARGAYQNNQIKYNKTSELFSCYGEDNNQKDVVIYKEVCVQDQYIVTSTLTNTTATNTNPTTVAATATTLTLKYSAYTSYLLPETIIVKMGGVELVSGTDYTWNKEDGTLTFSVTGFYGDIDVEIVSEADPCYQFEMSTVTATSNTPNTITLTWTEVEGATGYNVKIGTGEFTPANGLTHTFEGLSPKTPYNWEVQAVKDDDGFHCEASKTGSTTTQKETFTVSWSVNGNVTSTESVVDGESIQDTPSTPSDQTLEDCGANKFMGWSEKSAGSTPQDAAYYDDLCSAEDMIAKYPSITSSKTFYAVFATISSGGGENTAQVFATSSLGNTNSVTTGFAISAGADKKEGYYQDGSGRKRYVQVMKSNVSTSMFTNTPTNVTVTAKLGGGTTRADLTNSVYAIWLDKDGKELGNAVLITDEITATTGSDFTVNLPIANATSAYGVRVYHQKESNYNVRYYAISLSYKYNNTTYSNYVTNCCNTPAPTNGAYTSVSGTEIKLTWDDAANTNRYHITGGNLSAEGIDVTNKYYNITGLTECEEYTFYVSADPTDGCESEAITITAQPFSGAKTVTFNPNGGSVSPTSFTTSCDKKSTTLPTPTYSGYRFMGWFNAASGGTKIGEAGTSYTPTADITLFAHWEKEYTVTYDLQGGTASPVCSGDKYIAGEIVIICTSTPVKSGYRFTGWTYSPVVTITNGQFTMPASNVTITAEFVARAVTNIEVATNTHRVLMQGSAFIGEQIRVKYDNGETELLEWSNSKLTFAGHNTNELGVQTVTVTYTGEGTAHTQYNIEVIDGLGITFWDGDYTETIKYEPGDLVDVDNKIGQNICSGWEFAGWSETKVANESNGFTPVHNFNATDAKVLYAVYAEIRMVKEGDVLKEQYKSADMVTDLQEGARYIVAAYVNSNNSSYGYTALTPNSKDTYYMAGTHTANDGFAYTQEKNDDNSNIYCTTYEIDCNNLWRIESDGDGYWQLFNIATKKYLDLSAHENQYLTTNNYPNGKIVIYDYISSIGDNDSRLELRHSTEESDGNKLYWDRREEYFRQTVSTSGLSCIYCLTKDKSFTSTPPCSPLSATFHGNGGIVTDGVNSGDNLTITEPTRDAGITTPTASFADCNGKSWTFVGWSREEIDVTRVPVLTTDLLHDGGGNKHYDIEEDGEEFWAVFTNIGNPETKYGTITFTDADVTREYADAKKITKSVTAMGDYDFELYRVSNASSKGIQFDHYNATKGYIKNITSLGKINSISLNDFQVGDIDDVKVYVGNTPNAINTLLTEADLQQTGNTYTYYPQKNYAYVRIEADGYCGITSISIDFGKGTQIWATTPDCSTITLSGDEIYVTATNGQSIRAVERLTVKAVQLESKAKVVISSNSSDIYFSDVQDANFTQAVKPTETLTLTTDVDGNLAATEIYVHYRPSVDGTGMPEDVVVSANLETPNPSITDDHTIHVRNLPADFVIAAKWDGHWYALPANCTSSQSPTEGLLIEVDNIDNPQMAIAAPASAKFGLKSVYTSNSTNDQYEKNGANLVFVENVTEETPVANQTLYNGSETGIQVYAQYANYHTGNALRYEWTPTTTNLLDYTLTSAHTFTKTDGTPEEARTISLGNNGVFGTLLNDKSYNGEVRLLPATFYEPASAQVLKWKANSVIVMYTGTETTATTQVGDNAKSAEQTLANQQLTHGIYELTTNQALTDHAGGELNIYIGTNTRVELEIPLIISGKVTASANAHDVVILENSKLTAAENKYSYKDVYVYGGGKLAIPDGAQLGVNNIILRAGAVATNGAGQEATYQYIYPQVELKGTLTSSVQNIRYEYVTDYDHWYHLVLPFDGSLASIHYPYEYYGNQVKLDNKGSWIIKRYDGATRATGNYDAWKDIEKDEPKATIVTAGKGYIFWGAPKKVTANGVYERPKWGIQRITMLSDVSETISKAKDAENADKTISGLGSYKNVTHNSGADNDQGWNLIGNPYMVNLTGLNSQSLQIGQLIHETDASGNWTGKWQWDNTSEQTGLRYVTIPSDHFETYEAKPMTWFTEDNPMIAGRSFFVQIAGDATDLVFDVTKKAALVPALLAENNDKPVDIETGIVLSNETLQDEVNFWIKAGKTNDYEYNADYPKTPNNNQFNIYGVHTNGDLSWVATGPEYAAESMPIGYQVPAAGTYMLSLSEIYNSDGLDALYVTDHALSPEVTVDIMSEPYEFSVNQAETNNERFTVSVRVKAKTENGATGLGNVGADGEQIHKFIYQDKMYILHHGVIYDATGKRVITINK